VRFGRGFGEFDRDIVIRVAYSFDAMGDSAQLSREQTGGARIRRGPSRWFYALAPGILIAATGVGAGDLITASIAGSKIGVIIVWAALIGAIFKWTLNEGIARWQMATGTTLLEGWVERLGGWIQWVFAAYLIVWAFFTGGALVSACGIAGAGLFTPGIEIAKAKLLWGAVHSIVGLGLVWFGGFKLFEKVMSVCIGVMFVAVMVTAVMIKPDWPDVGVSLVTPSITKESLPWILGLLGGVGGSVTLLSYGYWIREQGRTGRGGVASCRLDLAVGYLMTALFGIAMVVIGSRLSLDRGDTVAIMLAGQLEGQMGAVGRWVFLAGFWGAVFSSLLGVWQSIPYLFADFLLIRKRLSPKQRAGVDYTRTPAYRGFLIALALAPLLLLDMKLERVQLYYAVMAALFMPLLALTLLIMNNRTAWVGAKFKSGWLINAVLTATLAFFVYAAYFQIRSKLTKAPSSGQQAAVAIVDGSSVDEGADGSAENTSSTASD